MNPQIIQISKESKFYDNKKFTLYEQDSDSKFYDEKSASRVVEKEFTEPNFNMNESLILSRTRIEFSHEHLVWADSDYLKSLGNEDQIYSKFLKIGVEL